jgi:hypothetical protein
LYPALDGGRGRWITAGKTRKMRRLDWTWNYTKLGLVDKVTGNGWLQGIETSEIGRGEVYVYCVDGKTRDTTQGGREDAQHGTTDNG